jgi:hypothetical protein
MRSQAGRRRSSGGGPEGDAGGDLGDAEGAGGDGRQHGAPAVVDEVRDEVDDARRHGCHGERERDRQQRNGPVVLPSARVRRDDGPGVGIGAAAG